MTPAIGLVIGLGLVANPQVSAQEKAQDDLGGSELLAGRNGNLWRVPVAASGRTSVPRVCASLRNAYFEGMPDRSVLVHPEVNHWELRFEGEAPASHVILEFDSFPATLDEAKPSQQAGDGTITLSCSQGRTSGEKLRFEPQPHKNTIGYWAVASDSVSWPLVIAQPGEFNVGLLQGAGDKGGGVARVSLIADDVVIDAFEFEVEVTGHFQNFRWKHAGTFAAKESGSYTLRIEAAKIDNVALMDVRQVHLSPKR